MTADPLHDRGVIHRYRSRLALPEGAVAVSLNEGSTPLIHSPKLSEKVRADVFLKYEGLNPTGSFKDRGMTVAISAALARGTRTVICASTGNTSAAAAAYAARAGIGCAVLLPAGKIASGKLVQAFAYGAKVIALRGNFDDALRLVREVGAHEGVAIVNSINPDRIEGQKTAAFEVVDVLGDAPDLHILPVGNAGNITAYWKGYKEDAAIGRTSRRPVMLGFQAAGSAPIYHGHVIEKPSTLATAIRIGNPASWQGARDAITESGGAIEIVTDEEILAAQRWLASHEGIFVEPASAASVAGLFKCLGGDRCAACPLPRVPEGGRVVLTVTGHGLKDPEAVGRGGAIDPVECAAERDAVLTLLEETWR